MKTEQTKLIAQFKNTEGEWGSKINYAQIPRDLNYNEGGLMESIMVAFRQWEEINSITYEYADGSAIRIFKDQRD